MKTNIVSCVYPPEPVVSARTSAEIADELARLGHQVTVLAPFPSHPTRQAYPQYKRGLLQIEVCSPGHRVIRCFSFFSSISSLWSRFLENVSFGFSVFFVLLFSPRADIVYGNTWPIFSQGLLVLACKLRHMPLILSIQDLYPESLVIQNRIGNSTSWYIRFLRWLDILIAQNCQSLVVISGQFKNAYVRGRGIAQEKIHVIPNWVDRKHISVDYQNYSIRQRHNIPEDAFLIVYGGNIGIAAGVDIVIQAFEHLKDMENIHLLIAGDGTMLNQCRILAKASDNVRITFHNPWSVDETSSVLDAANLLILPTSGNQSLVSVPSKLLSYLMAARPILVCAHPEAEVSRIVTESDAGWVISASTQEISQKIREISATPPEILRHRGLAGRTYALRHYSAQANIPKIMEVFHKQID